MPTCSLPKSGPTPALVSTLKSVVFPAAGRPTIPASSIFLVLRDLLLQGGESAMLEGLDRALGLFEHGARLAVREVEQELQHQHLLLLEREVLDQLEHALAPDRVKRRVLGRRLGHALRLRHLFLGLPATRRAEVV